MEGLCTSPHELTLQIVLATIPQKQEEVFDDSVRTRFYDHYRNASQAYFNTKEDDYWYHSAEGEKVPVLYNPLRYYILGNYDIAYVALIDNFKFAQRLFEPQSSDSQPNDVFSPHTFQSFTGIAHQPADEMRTFFFRSLRQNKPVQRYFMGIMNLKLNNGILIGNGMDFLTAAYNQIHSCIQTYNKAVQKKTGSSDVAVEYLMMQSFSWFEISLVLFTDEPSHIKSVMQGLRRISLKDMPECVALIEQSLYQNLFSSPEIINNVNLFSDTHTYIGMHADLIRGPLESPFVQAFLSRDIDLESGVEWQIKPGHMPMLKSILCSINDDKGKPVFDFNVKYLLAGKSDYLLNLHIKKASSNVFLMRKILDKTCAIFDHVRKIKTRVFFPMPGGQDIGDRPILRLQDELRRLAVSNSQALETDTQLKKLKISRQIRSKVLKIFSNYNNGIQDIILFPFFLDFYVFIRELQTVVAETYDQWQGRFASLDTSDPFDFSNVSVNTLENRLTEHIHVFQEAYDIRMLNCYQFEDINDFDLDFNSSIQQLLSVYATIAFEVGNLFYPVDYGYGPLVQLNLKDTVSNYNAINYHVHHLTSPEFVFATLTKEVLNFIKHDNEDFRRLLGYYSSAVKEIKIKNYVLAELIMNGMIDPNYLFNDAIRFVITYDYRFDLFEFWFWTYNFQNTSLYDLSGSINEDHFQKEMFRILFVQKLFNFRDKPLNCPVPEFYTYWDRHFKTLDKVCDQFIEALEASGVIKMFMVLLKTMMSQMFKKLLQDCSIPEINKDEAQKKLAKIFGSAGGIFGPFLGNWTRKEYAYQKLSGQHPTGPSMEVPKTSLLYLQWQMTEYLSEICKQNDGVVSLLRRDWETGKPLLPFIIANTSDHLYSIDQTGGVFFDNISQMNKYFTLCCNMLQSIWHYSLVRKKNFILTKKNQPNTEDETR